MDLGAKTIRKWHVEDNGWSDIGYHWIVRRDGMTEKGRSEEKPGAHVAGQNHDSIGICWIGRDNPTSEQLESLYKLVLDKLWAYHLAPIHVKGHYEYTNNKTCPNLDMGLFRMELELKLLEDFEELSQDSE